jgi:hypothetical protein
MAPERISTFPHAIAGAAGGVMVFAGNAMGGTHFSLGWWIYILGWLVAGGGILAICDQVKHR